MKYFTAMISGLLLCGCRTNHVVATESKTLAPKVHQGKRHIWIKPRNETPSSSAHLSLRSW